MQYTLSPVPVSIATADGSKRGIKKSNLPPIMKDKMIDQDITIIPEINKVSAYILDFIVFLITITDILSTLEDLEWRVKKQIPAGHNWVDIVTHTYSPVSIKMQEKMVEGDRIASSPTQLNQEPLVISRNFCQMVKINQN